MGTLNSNLRRRGFPPTKTLLSRLTMLFIFLLGAGLLVASEMDPIIYLGDTPGDGSICHCLDNATTQSNGQFSETVTVESSPGETWTVTQIFGFYDINSPAPPGIPSPISIGTNVPEVGLNSGKYQIQGIHIDGAAFQIKLSNGTDDLMIGNTCYYPNISLVDFPEEVCLSSLPITLEADVNGVDGTGVFRIDDIEATIFDPRELGAGMHTITYTFDAGAATPNDMDDPGCTSVLSAQVLVHEVPNTVTNSLVNVPLGYDCEALIVPDMILEGEYPCLDNDYYVVIYDLWGLPIGNVVTGEYLGDTLIVDVFTQAGGYHGTGAINITLGFDLALDCPDDESMATVEKDVYSFADTLYNDDPTIIPANFQCFSESVDSPIGVFNYHLDTIEVTQDGIYVLEGYGDFGEIGAVFYDMEFTPFSGPCSNYMAISESLPPGEGYYQGVGNVARVTANLHAGMSYILVTIPGAAGQTGAYHWSVYTLNGGAVVGIPHEAVTLRLPLVCKNYEQVLNNPQSLLYTGQPITTNNCQELDLTFDDELINGGDCAPTYIQRTFTGVDIFGEAANCTQNITFTNFDIDDLSFPSKTYSLGCDEVYETLSNGNPSPSVTGYPFVLTAFGAEFLAPTYCNLIGSYADQPRLDLCGSSYQFVRRWYVLDNCNNEGLTEYDQLIRIMDFEGPTVTSPAPDVNQDGLPDTLQYSTTPYDCTGIINVPMPIVSDNCNGWNVRVNIISEVVEPVYNIFGNLERFDTTTQIIATILPNAPSNVVTDLPIGCHLIQYIVDDDCGNETIIETPFCISDLISPTAACDDDLNISIGGDGLGRVYAIDINEGSNDNCAVASIEARRLLTMDLATCEPLAVPIYSDWSDFVEFSCCEVGTMINVDLRVTDTSGNSNVCSTVINVTDNSVPICIAPIPIFTTCDDFPMDFDPSDISILQDLYGVPTAIDNCTNYEVIELEPIVDFIDCGGGTVVRRFQIVDQFGNVSPNVCNQLITVETSRNYSIRFPKDIEVECDVPNPEDLILLSMGCEQYTIEVEDVRYDVIGDACYEISRTYHIKDWCEYDGYSPAVDIRRDEDCDGTLGEENTWLIRRTNGAFIDQDNNENNNIPAANTRGSACDGNSNPSGYWREVTSTGYWKYSQRIRVTDHTDPTVTYEEPSPFCSSTNNCLGNVFIPFTVADGCSGTNFTITVFRDLDGDGNSDTDVTSQYLSGAFPNYAIGGLFPMGTHNIDLHVQDACGNITVSEFEVQVVDCLAPTPNCTGALEVPLNALAPGTDLDGNGSIDLAGAIVNATDLVTNLNAPDCSGPISYSIHRSNEVATGADVPNVGQLSLPVTCEDLGGVIVRVYAWDHAFNPYAIQPNGAAGGPNYNFCETFLNVLDDTGICTGNSNVSGSIAGRIFTEDGAPVEQINVDFGMPMEDGMTTNALGEYQAEELSMGGDYMVDPQSNDDYLNGVSTFDLIMISKHILGVQYLDSPYKIIAADVNHSNSVSTIDLIHLRKLILGQYEEFPNSSSWRFIPSSYEFPNINNPWEEDFEEVIMVDGLDTHLEHQDFIAIKIGDVNGNATTNRNSTEERADNGVYFINVFNDEVRAGQEYRIDFTAGDVAELQGLQMTLHYDVEALELLNIEYGVTDEGNFGTADIENGQLSFSWNHPTGGTIAAGTQLFSLVFYAGASNQVSELLSISSRITKAEAYTKEGAQEKTLGVDINFVDRKVEGTTEAAFELYQNIPNPFRNRTTIPFSLPEASKASLTIYDVSGREWKRMEAYYEAGYNQIQIDLSSLPVKGVLYYKLETSRYTATKKMVILE